MKSEPRVITTAPSWTLRFIWSTWELSRCVDFWVKLKELRPRYCRPAFWCSYVDLFWRISMTHFEYRFSICRCEMSTGCFRKRAVERRCISSRPKMFRSVVKVGGSLGPICRHHYETQIRKLCNRFMRQLHFWDELGIVYSYRAWGSDNRHRLKASPRGKYHCTQLLVGNDIAKWYHIDL